MGDIACAGGELWGGARRVLNPSSSACFRRREVGRKDQRSRGGESLSKKHSPAASGSDRQSKTRA